MLTRVLETEAMATLAEALDYDAMDHREVNCAFVAELLAQGPLKGEVLDLGTGTALIPVELCRREWRCRVWAVDASAAMLLVAAQNVAHAGYADRIRLHQADAKRLPYRDGQFAAVISNSILHHIPDPTIVLREAWRVVRGGGLLFFRDLFRPADENTLHRLVETYAAGANAHQQQMFADSLRAALSVEEVRAMVAALGVDPATVQPTSDRHWTWVARKVEDLDCQGGA